MLITWLGFISIACCLSAVIWYLVPEEVQLRWCVSLKLITEEDYMEYTNKEEDVQ